MNNLRQQYIIQPSLFRIFTGEIYPVRKNMAGRVEHTYTGHDTFACRSYWLKKGYDFKQTGESFNSPNTPSLLGVGKNMVRAIKHWYKAFGLDDNATMANSIFADNAGWDPYLEDVNTIWLLHYLLIKRGYAKIYSDFFNDFRKKQIEFSIDNFERFLASRQPEIATKTLKSDINVLKINYIRPSRKTGSIEDTFTVFLQELNLIDELSPGIFHFNMRKKSSLSNELFLYSIMEKSMEINSKSLSFDNLMYEKNGPGSIFCITQEEMYLRLQEISQRYEWIVFTEDAGIREIQINKKSGEYHNILESYYGNKEN